VSRQKGVHTVIATSRGQTMAEHALMVDTIAIGRTALVQNAGAIVKSIVDQVSIQS